MKNKSWYLYILLCKYNNLYIGISQNPKKRLLFHQLGLGAYFTKQYPPTNIIYTERFNTYLETRRREKQIKGWHREKKDNLIKYGKPFLKNNSIN